MAHKETLEQLKGNPQQAKQFNEVATFINDALKKEMPVLMKLVQFDVLAEIQKKAIADGLKNANSGEKQLTETLDKLLGQVNKDLLNQISKACEKLKAQ
ncbi:MAG: hypothetical protein IK093_07475 [Ruminiclostridium sp.]|nr:hypothetical protein [Ruminiclostridium sp.]